MSRIPFQYIPAQHVNTITTIAPQNCEHYSSGMSEAPTDPDLALVLAARLQKIREAMGLTQEEFAHRAGTTQPYVSRLEGGHRFKQVQRLGEVIRAAGGDPLDLLTSEKPANAEEARLRDLARGADPEILRICISILERDVRDNEQATEVG